MTEGFVEFRGHRTWYRVSGEASPGTLPLLCLHGGPGSSSAYFHPLEELTGRQVVVYDQLGCGESDRPDDVEWSLELFVDEVGAVREQLGLDRIHLLGQSWGGILAQQYVLDHPGGVCSLILSSTLSSAEQWKTKRNRDVYHAMWGPNEWTCTGVLAGWDVRDRLGEIGVPTLVLRGGHDACTPPIAETMVQGIADTQYAVFEHSAHIPFVEEPDRYREVLTDFLERVEAAL